VGIRRAVDANQRMAGNGGTVPKLKRGPPPSRSARAAKAAIELQRNWCGEEPVLSVEPIQATAIAITSGRDCSRGPTNMRQFVHYLILGGFVCGTGVILALALHVVP
jgi:hypothetical protein